MKRYSYTFRLTREEKICANSETEARDALSAIWDDIELIDTEPNGQEFDPSED